MAVFQKIGILGGSFNPVHNGHIQAALGAAKTLSLDRVLLIPVAQPPHKPARGMASGEDRLAMCRLACDGYEKLEACGLEVRRAGPSYTFETLLSLKKEYPAATLFLLCGTDMFVTVLDWKNSGSILQNAVICMAPRGEAAEPLYEEYAEKIQSLGGKTAFCPLPKVDISSTMIRQKAAKGEKINALVPPAVEDYIYCKNLYARGGERDD